MQFLSCVRVSESTLWSGRSEPLQPYTTTSMRWGVEATDDQSHIHLGMRSANPEARRSSPKSLLRGSGRNRCSNQPLRYPWSAGRTFMNLRRSLCQPRLESSCLLTSTRTTRRDVKHHVVAIASLPGKAGYRSPRTEGIFKHVRQRPCGRTQRRPTSHVGRSPS